MRRPRPPDRGSSSAVRRRRRWAAAAALVVLAALAGGLAAALSGPSPSPHGAAASSTSRHAGTTTTRQAPTTTTAPAPTTTTTTTGPGTLPPTDTLPAAATPQFTAEMAALWKGIVAGNVTTAMPAFFPEGAYLQLKDLWNARTDFQDRLVNEFHHDLVAAHELLGSDPSAATFVSVNVPQQYAHWVGPGVCYNSIGYYELPNARVVYRLDGAVKSFGIASLISWRGEWYVVHLGRVARPTTTQQGLVDDPATGPGTSAYSSTC